MFSHVTFWGKFESREHHRSWWLTFLSLLFLKQFLEWKKRKPCSILLEPFLIFWKVLYCAPILHVFLSLSHLQNHSVFFGCHLSGEPVLWIPRVEQCPFIGPWLSTHSKQYFFKAFNISWNECSMQARILLLFLILIILYVWVFCVNICLYLMCMCAVPSEAR